MSQPTDINYKLKPKGILKKTADAPSNNVHLRWDEEKLRITEAEKSATMKIDEPRTPYIRYNPENDVDLDEMEELKLASDISRSSSVASSPKRAQVVAPSDWASESESEGDTEADKVKHERFRKLRQQHYHLEGKYVHKDSTDINDSDDSMGSEENESSGDDADRSVPPVRMHGAKNGVCKSNGSKDCESRGCSAVDEANAATMEM
ncbi:hypothetical protein IW148_000914 [Coemansia sp. RSA 1199]|nr:hypothetical protein IW148_000914 [Coemansia sp. RSA 1199]